jgi:hypothetical protein
MLFGSTGRIVHSFKVEGDITSGRCTGYDADGQQIVRVPLKEPIVIRQKYDEQRDVHRISIS